MKIPRRCFAEAVWLYQNDGGKAMVFPMAVITNYYVRSSHGLGLVASARSRKYVCLTSVGSYGVLLGIGRKKPICFVAINCLTPMYRERKPPLVNFVLHLAPGA